MLMKLLPCNRSSAANSQRVAVQDDDEKLDMDESLAVNMKVKFEEVSAWGTSFDRLMKHELGQKVFGQFLKGEFSDENILFWLACEELKHEVNEAKIAEKAQIIYTDFISILSAKEVSLDAAIREAIEKDMAHPTVHTFDDAQRQIYELMQSDSYPRFIASVFYKKILDSYGQMVEL